MDGLLALLALVVLAVPVTLVALVIGQSGLRNRLSEAERTIKANGGDCWSISSPLPSLA
jgi:hypothetical protein